MLSQANSTSSGTSFPIFSLRFRVGFSWMRCKGAIQYRYQIVDLQTQASVKLTSTSKLQGFLPADRNLHPTSYKVAVHALSADESVLCTWQHFFYAGAPTMGIPYGETIHDRYISFQNAPAFIDNREEELALSRIALTSPALFNGIAPPEFILSNRFFLSHNSNRLDHWMNSPLSRTFLTDINQLAEDPDVGFDCCDHQLEWDTFLQLNAYRGKKNLSQLIWNDNLARAARGRAFGHILSPGFSHNMPCIGGALEGSLTRWGLKPQTGLRENIAWMRNNFSQQYCAENILQAWLDSPAHDKNMLREARYLGIGVILKKGKQMQGLEAVMISVL